MNKDIKNEKYALTNDEKFGKVALQKAPTSWVRSTCGYCGVGCGVYIGVKDTKPVYTKGDPEHPVNQGTLCPKGLSEHEMVQSSPFPLPHAERSPRYADVLRLIFHRYR